MSEDDIINVIKFDLAPMLLNTVYMWPWKRTSVSDSYLSFRTWPNKVSQLS